MNDNEENDTKNYKSPKRKLLHFFEKSRDKWKTKYKDLKYKFKLQSNQVQYLKKRTNELSSQIKELEKQLTIQEKKTNQ